MPRGGVGRFGDPRFADGVEIRIFLAELAHPFGHGDSVGIGIGVHANAVDSDGFDPPNGVLNKVFQDMGIALVEVGHGGNKPAFGGFAKVDFRGIGVENGREFVSVGSIREIGTSFSVSCAIVFAFSTF